MEPPREKEIIILNPYLAKYRSDPEFRETVKQKVYESRKKLFEENPEEYQKHRDYIREYQRNRYQTDPEYRAKKLESVRRRREAKKLEQQQQADS